MKIAINGSQLFHLHTGIGQYVYYLLNSLAKIDNKNSYYILTDKPLPYKWQLPGNFTIVVLQAQNTEEWRRKSLVQFLLRKSISIYHDPNNGLFFPETKVCKLMVTIHDLISYRLPATVPEQYLQNITKKLPEVISNSNLIITDSINSSKDIYHYFPNLEKNKVKIVYPGINDIYHPNYPLVKVKEMKAHYGINEDYILNIGGFIQRKNIFGLVNAYAQLIKKTTKKYQLVLVGNKCFTYKEVLKRAEALGINDMVIFTDYVPEQHLPLLYKGASLFVYPSLYEGFGLPPLEAQKCGTPVVSSNTSSLPEVLGNSAELCDPQNTLDIVDAMLRVLEDENYRKDLISRGFKNSRKFNWKKTAKKILECYFRI